MTEHRGGRPNAARAAVIARRRRRVEKRYLAGASISGLARRENVAAETVRADLLARGVQLRPRGGVRKHGADECRRCASCGEPFIVRASDLARGRGHYCSKGCEQKTAAILTSRERKQLLLVWYVVEARTQRWIARRLRLSEARVHLLLEQLGLETDAHRRPKRHLRCEACGAATTSWDVNARFCSRICWGRWRWKHRDAIAATVASLRADGFWSPSANQRWEGRWGGAAGAAHGAKGGEFGARGGAISTLTAEEKVRILELDRQGLSTRQIALEVLGRQGLKDRVARFLNA